MTAGQRRALEAIDAGKVTMSMRGNLLYRTRDVNPSSMAACRRRGWIAPDVHRERLVLTAQGRRALVAVA